MANPSVSPAAWHELRVSRTLVLGEALLTIAATICTLALDVAAWPRGLIIASVWLVPLRTLLDQRKRSAARITALRLLPAGRLEARDYSGHVTEYHIDPATTLLGPLVVMHLTAPTGKRTLTLLPDSLSHDSSRQLRVWLRWHANLVEYHRY